MSKETQIPDILVLTALNAVEHDGVLESPNLSEKVSEYSVHEGAMWEVFGATKDGSLEESYEAKRLAGYYLLRTAEKLQNRPRNDQLWVERFNQANQEIYGVIDPHEAAKVAAEDVREIAYGLSNSHAANIYRQLAGNTTAEASPQETEKAEQLRKALFDQFPEILETIGELAEGPYPAHEIRDIFGRIVQKLAKKDQSWAEWSISNPEGKTMLSVIPSKKQIEVPDGREPIETKGRLLGLALHEIGVHAQRAVNGLHTKDDLMEKGLPDYIDFEEGLGVLFEYLATGEVPYKIKDRYIDIALATGAVNGIMLNRHQLRCLANSRGHSRSIARYGVAADSEKLGKDIAAHINRIFRGGNGQPIKNSNGQIVDQAVFVKDMVYYSGFLKARAFAYEQLSKGVLAHQLIEFLLSGKFDAANNSHLEYLKERHSISL